MERKRLLIACGIITLLAVVGIVTIVAVSLGNQNRHPSNVPTPLTVSGNLTCLHHKNVAPGQPVTLECAIGLKTADGRFYALKNLSPDDSTTDFSKQVTISGNVVPPTGSELYDIVGTLNVTTFSAN